MKKLIFKAGFLALATLTIFSACKKDEVIEPEFIEKEDNRLRYDKIACITTDKMGNPCAGEAIVPRLNGSYSKPKICTCVD